MHSDIWVMEYSFLFDLIIYVPLTIFQCNRDGSSWFGPVLSYDKCVLLKDQNKVTLVRLKPAVHRSRVKHSTTKPLHSQTCGSGVPFGKHSDIWIMEYCGFDQSVTFLYYYFEPRLMD